MNEQWKIIDGVDSSYSVSDMGRVRNNDTGFILSDKRRGKTGYVLYRLYSGGRPREFTGHRLVAQAFLGEPTGPIVRHLDDVKNNNVVANLAYGTQSDNMQDASRNGSLGGPERWQSHCHKGHEMTGDNLMWISARRHPICRACKNAWAREYKARERAKRREAA